MNAGWRESEKNLKMSKELQRQREEGAVCVKREQESKRDLARDMYALEFCTEERQRE